MSFRWFANIVANYPYVIIIIITLFSGTCLILPFTSRSLPNFSDPQLGFETRGTILANRITAWKNLLAATKPSGPLITSPQDAVFSHTVTPPTILTTGGFPTIRIPKAETVYGKQRNFTDDDDEETSDENRTDRSQDKWALLRHMSKSSFETIRNNKSRRDRKENYFCGPPDDVYTRVVIEAKEGEDLFRLESLLNICLLQSDLTVVAEYPDLCVQSVTFANNCCRPWSVPNYIAQLSDKSNCMDINEADIEKTKSLLDMCAPYFHNFTLQSDCYENKCNKNIPYSCQKFNSVYNIFNYLTSTSFLPSDENITELVLKQTMIFLPIATSVAVLPYYMDLEEKILNYESVSVVAAEFGIKSELFNYYLKNDARLLSMGILFVLLCILMYTRSFFLTGTTIIAILFSLGISYFIYTYALNLHFFPFMNLLVIVVAIGIGADDAFIFCKVWNSVKEESTSIPELLNTSFKRVFMSVLITSATTAAAFSASYVSLVTTIRCFSIFATTAVVVNLIVMMSWLPACIVVLENWNKKNLFFNIWNCSCFRPIIIKVKERLLQNNKVLFILRLWNTRYQILADGLLLAHESWLLFLTIFTFCSFIIVFVNPKLQLPTSDNFQLFKSSHLFEKYDLIYKHMFWFSKPERDVYENSAFNKLPLRFVWGVQPKDNGNHLDPSSLGELELDPNFDLLASSSQEWMLSFCRNIRKQPFYRSTSGPLLSNCFIEYYAKWMRDRRCNDTTNYVDNTPCCQTSTFPFTKSLFNHCIVYAIGELVATPSPLYIPGPAGLKFDKYKFPAINALVIEYDSNYSYSTSYEHMKEFVDTVEAWMTEQLKTAPSGLRNGWFVSDFQFYDLQSVLSKNTITSISLSMSLSFVVLMLATLNFITSTYAVITISSSILGITAILVILGWQLNVLESIAISTSVGLAVDFSLHYIIHYGLCPDLKDRKIAAVYALTHMAGPTLMAAVTTGAVGAFMMPSCIIPYIRIGIFLSIVMCVSWVYATFFLGSLLALAGPQNNFGQLSISTCTSCCLSAVSSAGEFENGLGSSTLDNFELESLNSIKDIVPTPTECFGAEESNSSTLVPSNDISSPTNSAITVILLEGH